MYRRRATRTRSEVDRHGAKSLQKTIFHAALHSIGISKNKKQTYFLNSSNSGQPFYSSQDASNGLLAHYGFVGFQNEPPIVFYHARSTWSRSPTTHLTAQQKASAEDVPTGFQHDSNEGFFPTASAFTPAYKPPSRCFDLRPRSANSLSAPTFSSSVTNCCKILSAAAICLSQRGLYLMRLAKHAKHSCSQIAARMGSTS